LHHQDPSASASLARKSFFDFCAERPRSILSKALAKSNIRVTKECYQFTKHDLSKQEIEGFYDQ